MTNRTTVNLVGQITPTGPLYESLLVEPLGDNRYRLLKSPGLVPGLAAGDEFEVTEAAPSGYKIIRRGGNVAVQLFAETDLDTFRGTVEPLIQQIGGWLDGEVQVGNNSELVV